MHARRQRAIERQCDLSIGVHSWCIRKISPVCRFSKVRKSSTILPPFLWPTNLWLRRSPMPLRRPRPRTRFAGCRLRQRPYPSPTVWRGKHRDAIAANLSKIAARPSGRTAAHGDTPVFPLMFSPGAPSLRGFRPRLPGARARPRRFSIAATNAAEPSGRPISSLRPEGGEGGRVGFALDKIGEARRAVDERLDPDAD